MVSRLSRLVYPPGDAVFQEGEIATEMFFVASGTVTIQYKGEHVATLTTGGYFGEFALLEVRCVVCVGGGGWGVEWEVRSVTGGMSMSMCNDDEYGMCMSM